MHQPPDALTELLGIGGVELSIVAHHWVHNHRGALGGKLLQELLHQLNLPRGTQKTRKDSLEFQIELLPFRHIGRHGIGKVLYIKALKARMVGKNRRGQGTALNPQMGNQRQCHRNGAPAKAGKIVDNRYFFLVIMGQGMVPPFRILPKKTPKAPP